MQELRNITSALTQRTQLATFGISSQSLQNFRKSAGTDHIQSSTKEAQPQLQRILSDSAHLQSSVAISQSNQPSVFAFDTDSAAVYAIVNAQINDEDLSALDPAKTQSTESLEETKELSTLEIKPQEHSKKQKSNPTKSSIPIIVKVSAASQSVHPKIQHQKPLVDQLSTSTLEEKVQVSKQGASGFLDTSVSADEIEVQFKGEIEQYTSLAQQQAQSSHCALFANERNAGISRYELPQSTVNNKDHVINFIDTYNQPQCMRFCPSLSSSNVELSHTGLTAKALSVKDASGQAKETFVVTNMAFSEGVHYWEFICPISINSMHIGVTSNGTNPTIITETFLSSTRRTVGVYLDLNNGDMSFWINGRHCKKSKSKQLKKLGYAWRPYLRFMEEKYIAILKPFCTLPYSYSTPPAYHSRLPDTLTDDLHYIQISYLADLIRNQLLVINLPNLSDDQIKTNLQKLGNQEFQIVLPSQAEKAKNASNIALLKFPNQIQANLYAQNYIEMKDVDMGILDAWNIAKLVHSRFTNTTYRIGFNNVNKIQMQTIRSVYSKFLIDNLLDAQEWVKIQTMVGFTEQLPLKSELNDVLLRLQFLVKQHRKNVLSGTPTILSKSSLSTLITGPTQIAYLKNSQNLLVTNGPEVKVFSKPLSEGTNLANFSNYAQFPEDKIGLQLSIEDLDFLLEYIPWQNLEQELSAINFLRDVAAFYDNGYVILPYVTALSGVNAFIEIVRKQYVAFDTFGNRVNMKDIKRDTKITKNPAIKKPISFRQVNKMMKIVLCLEDQLWAMTQSDSVSERVKRLWAIKTSRIHTAYSRLESFVSFTDSEDPLNLAELGLYNYSDQEKKLSHFMEPGVPLESIYEDQGSMPLQISLEKQLANNYMLKGFDTWNVPLSKTINSLPPSLHQNFLPVSEPKYAAIDVIRYLSNSDFVLTGSKTSGSINIWSSRLGMNLVAGYNFMKQLYLAKESNIYTTLQMNSFKGKYTEHDVQLFLKHVKTGDALGFQQANHLQLQPKVDVEIQKDYPAPTEKSEEPEDDSLLIFGQFQAQIDFQSQIDQLKNNSSYDQSQSDEEFLEYGLNAGLSTNDVEFISLKDFHKAWNFSFQQSVQDQTLKPQVESLEEQKQEKPKKEDNKKDAEVLAKLLAELAQLGFTNNEAMAAYNKAKKKDLESVLDILIQEQEKKKLQNPLAVQIEKPVEYNVYNCEACTYLNDPPAKLCAICQTEAPKSAMKVDLEAQKAKQEEAEKLKQQEEEKLRLQEEKEKERLEKAKKEEEELKQKIEQSKNELIEYFKNFKIQDYYLASVNSGKTLKPIFTFAPLFNSQSQTLDLHFIQFKYRQSYIKNFVTNISNHQEFLDILKLRQTSVESLYPHYIGNQMSPENWTEYVSQKQSCILRPQHVGVARISLAEITSITQIGENITKHQPLFIQIVGKKFKDSTQQSVIVLKVEINHQITVVENNPVQSSWLSQVLQDHTNVIEKVISAQASEQSDESSRLLIQTQGGKLFAFQVNSSATKLTVNIESNQALQLEAGEILSSESNGIICVTNGLQSRTLTFDSKLFERVKQMTSHAAITSAELADTSSTENLVSLTEDQVLNLHIDPKKVTISSIEAYENLMSGAMAPASSNATYQSGRIGDKNKNLFAKHTWICESQKAQEQVGPMELRFEHPTSLVSLNIDLFFETVNSAEFLKQLSNVAEVKSEVLEQVSSLKEKPAEELISTETVVSKVPNLGVFSIKGFEQDESRPKVGLQSQKSSKDHYVPIVVKRNKGSSYNCQNISHRLVVDNDKMFGSNYAKPEITFQHIENDRVLVEKISIRTPFTSKTGAYPMGEGLIFLSDTLEHFENTEIFRSFTLLEYQGWRKLRQKDPRPLRPNEPVAYFQFDSSPQIIFELDEQRPARYIMLKPTGFRQRPNKLSQNTDLVPMEIQFFGVIGKTTKLSQPLECIQIYDPSQNLTDQIHSDYTCEVTLLDTNQQVASVQNFKIDQLRVTDMSLSPQTFAETPDTIAKTCQIEGISLIRIADSSILLRKVSGFSIKIRTANTQKTPTWKLTSASVVGQFTSVQSNETKKQQTNEVLFGNEEIPNYYYRSCLLTPKFFPVINKQIAKIASDSSYPRRLRMRVMTFLKRIMRIDSELTPLVFSQIDLDAFLKTNIIGQDSSCIQASCEFLQSFQAEPQFSHNLYEILIQNVQQLPEKFMPQKGHQALMGMLKWALPLDFKRTLEVLLDALYSQITMQNIQTAQSFQNIRYRTRFSQMSQSFSDCYPFDNQVFKNPEDVDQKKKTNEKDAGDQDQGEKRKEDLITCVFMEQTKLPGGKLTDKSGTNFKITTNATFFENVNIESIKVYMGSNQMMQFLMEITITDGSKLVFFKAYPLHVYSQLVEYADGMFGETKYAHALTIPRLNHKGENLTIEISLGVMLSNFKDVNFVLPDVAFEFYGKINDDLIDSACSKHAKYIEEQKLVKQVKQVQNSIKFIVYNVETNKIRMTPQQTYDDELSKTGEKVNSDMVPLFDEGELKTNTPIVETKQETEIIQTQASNVIEPNPLEIIQRDLEAMIMSEEYAPLTLQSCVSNIFKLQSQAYSQGLEKESIKIVPQKSLSYFMALASDFTKMVKFIFNWKGSQQLSTDTIRECFAAIDVTGQKSLANVSIELFTHFIANDAGQANQEMQQFFKDVLLKLMTQEEKSTFYRTVIDKFLSKPNDIISQKSVVESLLNIEIPETDLVLYLANGLRLEYSEESSTFSQLSHQSENPISMMYALLYMTEKLFGKLAIQVESFEVAKVGTKSLVKDAQSKVTSKVQPKIAADYTEDAKGEATDQVSHEIAEYEAESKESLVLNYDQVFYIYFQICLLVCKNENHFFDKDERISLLLLTFQNINCLGRVISMQALSRLLKEPKSLQLLLIEVLQLNDPELINSYKNLSANIRTRHKAQTQIQALIKEKPTLEQLGKIKNYREDSFQLHKFWSVLNSQMLELLTNLIDLELISAVWLNKNIFTPLLDQCQKDNSQWLSHLSFSIDEHIVQIHDIDKIQKILASKPEAPKKDAEEAKKEGSGQEQSKDLDELKFENVPEKRSSSGSLQILQSLIQILCSKNKPQEVSSFDTDESSQNNFLEQNLSKIWSLTLNSLRTVDLSELVEAKLLEDLIQAFLLSTEKIKQTTYMQILQISSLIAEQNQHGKFLCNLLFTTIPHIDANLKEESVVYAICQGWLDILILSSCTGELGPHQGDKSKGIFYQLDAEDVGKLLNFASGFLVSLLNLGSFEGSSGAKQIVVLRLNLALDMIRVAFLAKESDHKAIQSLFVKCESDESLRNDLKKTMDNLLLWLVLNGREDKDETYLTTLANTSLQTPATYAVKQITLVIKEILALVSDCVQNLESIKIALTSLMLIVRNINKGVASRAQNERIGFDTAIKLANRTNELFTKLLSQWLISDKAVNYFVFELKGFEFLLDTISCDKTVTDVPATEAKSIEKSVVRSALAKSDLSSLVKLWQEKKEIVLCSQTKSVFGQSFQFSPLAQIAPTTLNAKCSTEEPIVQAEEEKFDMPLAEVANQMTLLKTSSNDPVASYARTDWSANKRAYKHKMYTSTKAKNHLEYAMLFELPYICLIREIQIGCINYWQIDHEVYVEPLTVVVEAGLTQEKFTHICTLDILRDNAFQTAGATIYGKTMMEIDQEGDFDANKNLQQTIKKCLDGLQNFKAKFIQFRLRRSNLVAVENSPLAKQIQKPYTFAVHYISVTGYDYSKTVGNYSKLILREQKKTATEVMAQICSGEFSAALSIIANQEQTINKIKEHFDMLAQLIEVKSSMIEPIFISISMHNAMMGDWIIQRLIQSEKYQHAGLTGKLILCDRKNMVSRLRIMLDRTIETLVAINKNPGKLTQTLNSFIPFVTIFIKTLHQATSALNIDQAEIDLAVQAEVVSQIIDIVGVASLSKHNPEKLKLIVEFVILLITPPAPFANSKIDVYTYATEFLLSQKSMQSTYHQMEMKNIAGILACQQTKLATYILNNFYEDFYQILYQIKTDKKMNPDQTQIIIVQLKFWLDVSHDLKVRVRLQKNGLPIAIYDAIKEDEPSKAKRLIKDLNHEILETLTSLMLQLTAGDAEIEQKLSEQVIKDLQILCQQQDKIFINQIFLPLLKSEQVLPVSLQEKMCTIHQHHLDEQLEDVGVQKNMPFIPSSLLDNAMRSELLKGFKKVEAEQYTDGYWTQVFESKNKFETSDSFSRMKDAVLGEGPLLVLQTGTEPSGKRLTFGTFVENKVPLFTKPPDEYDNSGSSDEDGSEIPQSPKDIFFINVEGAGMHMYSMKDQFHPSGLLIHNKVFYIGFIQIAIQAQDEIFCGIIKEEVKTIDIGNNANSPLAEQEYHSEDFNFDSREIWVYKSSKRSQTKFSSKIDQKQYKITEATYSKAQKEHPWIDQHCTYSFFRSRPVYMVPSHIQIQNIAKILLKKGAILSTNAIFEQQINDQTLQQVYNSFMADLKKSERANNILDFEFDGDLLLSLKDEEPTQDSQDLAQFVQSQYLPKNTFFECFQEQGGIKKIISVTLESLRGWKNQTLAESWSLWLKELETFTQIPLYFQLFLQNKKSKDLLFSVLTADFDNDSQKDQQDLKKLEEELKGAVQFNYKILSEVFAASNSTKIRETAVNCGFLPRILERLSAISGEKPRIIEVKEEETDEDLLKVIEEPKLQKDESNYDPNLTKVARKGVGYSAKQGEIFNVGQYLENKKLRNDQIIILIDICTNLFNSDEWEAPAELVDQILLSALLPILESAFRNGSFLDMAKEAAVYHSYMALTRAIANQKNLAKCLVEIDKQYKPQQVEPIYKLVGKLNDLASIFLNCLTQQLTGENVDAKPKKSVNQKLTMKTLKQIFMQHQPDNDSSPSSSEESKENGHGKTTSKTNPKLQQMKPLKATLESLNLPQEASQLLSSMLKQIPDKTWSTTLNSNKDQNIVFKTTMVIPATTGKKDQAKQLMNSLKEFTKMSDAENIMSKQIMLEPEQKSPKSDDGWQTFSEQEGSELSGSSGSESEKTKKQKKSLASKANQLVKKKASKGQENKLTYTVKFSNEIPSDSGSNSESDSGFETVSESSVGVQSPKQTQTTTQATKKLTSTSKIAQGFSTQLASDLNKIPGTNSAFGHEILPKPKNPANKHKSNPFSQSLFSPAKTFDKYNSQKANMIQKIEKLIEQKKQKLDAPDSLHSSLSYYGEEKLKNSESSSSQNSIGYDKNHSSSSDNEENSSYYSNGSQSNSSDYGNETLNLKPKPIPIVLDSIANANAQVTQDGSKSISQNNQDVSELLARDVTKTYNLVMSVVEEILSSKQNENFIDDALQLPIDRQYRALLEPMRFDYMDMKIQGTQEYKHHYKSTALQNQTLPPSKMIRLAQELADLSNALPSNHTDSVFVRVDRTRVDMMKALICGAVGTPYAHGCFEFDLFCENNYPNGPPKMNLMTTGGGQIRFNPNLYHCGKVCLSLLGTWRGQATENWDPKLSTILQLLLSTQAIIMSQEVYFNEPGFEGEAGTKDGERRNEGYSNIVRYGNVKWAMLGQLKSPPKGFETVVKRHFYIKKAEILKDLYKWIERAEKVEALYTNLVNDHNHNIAKDFQKSKTRYKEALEKEVKEFEEALNLLEKPTNYLPPPKKKEETKKTEKKRDQAITDGQAVIDDVDMGTDSEDDKEVQIDTTGKKKQHGKDIDVEDDAVKDRWSRYIGAMGVEAVAKQAAANIFVSGAGALGVEISKNLVLSGCKSFTLHDEKPITQRDLSGQFFLNAAEGKTRSEVSLPRLQQLNFYVRCKLAPNSPIPHDPAEMEKEPWNFQTMDVIILTDADYKTIMAVNDYCHSKGKKFINADLKGVFGRVFNDFGEQFEVLDKNGEELQDVMIKSISTAEEATIELLQNNKHKFEDGDECLFTSVQGMKLKEGEKQTDPAFKSDSINETVHKVKVLTPYSFKIGSTLHFQDYECNGIVKQLRTKRIIKFKSFKDTMVKGLEDFKQDENLTYCDFEKMANNLISHIAFEALETYQVINKQTLPRSWNLEDSTKFIQIAKTVAERYEMKPAEWKPDGIELRLLHLFCFQAQGVFNPMAAFFGGFVAQEVVKAITQKFSPSVQVFYYDASEVLPEFNIEKHCNTEDNKTAFEDYLKTIAKTQEINHRSDGLRIVLGGDLVEKLSYANVFMVGAGAIGCELLKNYAMLGVGTGKAIVDSNDTSKSKKAGSIVLTDPDIIEVSNLNRQFLFREKHLRKPKSQTAAAAAIYMNPDLKGNVIARLDKVHEGTNHIFTDKFFEDLTLVTNALDNVQARKYMDVRCVTAKTPLLESGTLGPKGHVQVILPYQTESYGSMQDPEDNTEIPQCTLKMFPEETLHCIEWARDKFSKMFTQNPQSALKILEEGENINTTSQTEMQALRVGLKQLKHRPANFMDCVEYARIKFEKLFNHATKQLIHVYPLDTKTKEGNLFWSLPKRPPTPIEFDENNMLHCAFISANACLRANVFKIEIPSKTPRTDNFKKQVGLMAKAFKPPTFVPDDSKANEIKKSVNKEAAGKEEENKDEESKEEEFQNKDDIQDLKQEFLVLFKQIKDETKKSFEESVIKPEDFEKDNDTNFHVDFMYSSGNIRASCYKLEHMDWLTVKLKVGRIVPALATTTASIAGLQALELVKVVKGCKKEEFRNIFLNLAVPFLQASEPGPLAKVKLLEGLEVSLWDRWEVKNAKQMTLEGLIAHLEGTYKGLEIRDVMRGNQPIFFHAIMNAPGKESDRKKTMGTTLKKLTESDSDDLYVDLAITCVKKDDAASQILAGVPPIRVYF